MNKNNNICYTGVGSVKSGNHTRKKYTAVMNKFYKKECPMYIKSLKCKSCKKMKEMIKKIHKKTMKADLNNIPYKIQNKTQQKLLKQANNCIKCKKNTTKKCNLENYILFSGAEYGKC